MGARIARQIEELLGGEVGGRDALEDLLVGRIGRLGRASVLADQGLDRRPVDDVERIERAAAIVARIEGRRPSKSAKRLCLAPRSRYRLLIGLVCHRTQLLHRIPMRRRRCNAAVPRHALGYPFFAQDCVWRLRVVVTKLCAAARAYFIRWCACVIERLLMEAPIAADGTFIHRFSPFRS